jgi:hypothetical protein
MPKHILFWLIAAALLLLGFFLYHSRPANRLDVAPDAGREIEKAKSR